MDESVIVKMEPQARGINEGRFVLVAGVNFLKVKRQKQNFDNDLGVYQYKGD